MKHLIKWGQKMGLQWETWREFSELQEERGKKCGKQYKCLLDICSSGRKADRKEVGKNIGRSEDRNKNTVIMSKNEVTVFIWFDQKGSPCTNSKTKVWNRRGEKQKAEDFSVCDDRVLAHFLGKGQWTKETVQDRDHTLQENSMITHMLAQKDGDVNAHLLTWRQCGQSHMNRIQIGKDSVLKGKGINR